MKENFPNLANEIDFQEVQEAQRVPKTLNPRKHTPKHIIITLPRLKIGENLKSRKRKGESYLQRSAHKTISWFLKGNLTGKKGLERSIQSHKRQGPTSKITLSSKAIIRMEGQIKCFPDKVKLKEFTISKALLYEMLKGFILRKRRSKLWTVKWQHTHNYQQLNLKQKQKQTKQTMRTGTESINKNSKKMKRGLWTSGTTLNTLTFKS